MELIIGALILWLIFSCFSTKTLVIFILLCLILKD